MKKIKFNLSNIEGKLSRVEMQQILGGSGWRNEIDTTVPEYLCKSSRRVYNSNTGQYYGCHKRDVRLSQ